LIDELFLMYKLVNDEWSKAVSELFQLLSTSLRNRFAMLIALDEDSFVYDSNVLVVVDKVDDEVRDKVAKAVIEVNSHHDCTISYYLTSKDDVNTIRVFSSVKEKKKEDCEDAFKEFKEKVKSIARDVIKAEIYDSNVLVVVDKVNDEVRDRVAEAVIEVNSHHDCTISYYLLSSEEYEKVRGTIKGSK